MYLECQKMDVWPSFHQLEGRTSEKWDFYISCLQWRFCQNKRKGKHIEIDRNRGSSWKFLMGLLPGSIRPVREIHSAAWDRVCLHTKQGWTFHVKMWGNYFHIFQLYFHFTNFETCRNMSKPTLRDPIRRAHVRPWSTKLKMVLAQCFIERFDRSTFTADSTMITGEVSGVLG